MDVYQIMNDIADCGNVTQQHIHNLYTTFLEGFDQFKEQLEKCYLKIIKNFNGTSKQHRKIFETITDKLVSFLIKKWSEQLVQVPAQKTRKQISQDNTRTFLLYMMQFFAEGLDSSQFSTRICCGRHLFMLLRCIPPGELNKVVDEKAAYDMLNHTVGLFKNTKLQKTGKTQKGLAVKLGSYLQHISLEDRKLPKLKQAIVALKYEMVKTICEDEKKELRLDALTNTELNESTLPFIIIRIRDTDVEIRLQVFKKLLKNKLSLAQLNTLDLYQVIYDGLKNSSQKVIDQCELYLQTSFGSICDSSNEDIQKSNRKSLLPEQTSHIVENVKKFLGLFQIEKTLIFPQLYTTIQDALKAVIKSQHQDELATFFRETLRNFGPTISGSQMTFIRVLCQMYTDKGSLNQQLQLIVDHTFPEGSHFANILNHNLDLLQWTEVLQLALLQINQEEIGRTKLLENLKNFISIYRELQCPRLNTNKYNEIYEDKTDQELECKWFAQHHFEAPIIKGYFELLLPAIKVLKLLLHSQEELSDLIFITIQHLQSQIIGDELLNKEKQKEAREEERNALQEEKETLLKKKKQNIQSLTLNEQLLDQNEKAITQLTQEIITIRNHNIQIDTHCLYLLDALFNQFDIVKVDNKLVMRLKGQIQSISERHKDDNTSLPRKLSFRCLGYIPLFGLDVGGATVAVLAKILDQTSPNENQDNPNTITALRGVLDSLLMYCDDQTWVTEGEIYTKSRILNVIVKFAFKSSNVVQATALEGLCKLLIHDKIPKAQIWIAQFLFLWFDAKLRSQQLPLQIVTSFLKLYITSSLQFLKVFEKGLEIYFSICCYLHYVKDQILNPQLFDTQQWQENSLVQAATAGIKMMSYRISNQKPNPSIQEFKEIVQESNTELIGPQERFIMYLCKLVSDHNNLVLQKIIHTVSKQADFIEIYDLKTSHDESKIQPKPAYYHALIGSLDQCIDRLEKGNLDIKNENAFIKVLREEVGTYGEEEGANLREKILKDFDIQREDANTLVKELKKLNVIVTGQKQQQQQQVDQNISGESDSDENNNKKKRQISSDSEQPKKPVNKKKR